MANEKRVRANFTGGLVDDNPLLVGATTLTSNALQALQVIDATQHMALVLDPDGYGGAPEIAYLTGHTSAAGTATLLRGQEGSTARAHIQDTPWVHSATALDFPSSLTYTVPSSTTVTSTSLASLATAITVAVPVVLNQVVDLQFELNGYCSGDNSLYWGLRRNPSTVLTKGTWYTGAVGTRPNSMSGRWSDTSPGIGTITYELLVAASGGTVTVAVSDGTTTITTTGSTGGGTQLTATPRFT